MNESEITEYDVYSQNVIEFVTVTAETCLLIENSDATDRSEFIDKLLMLFPLLYLKAKIVEIPEVILEDDPMRFVTEDDYNEIKEKIEQKLGGDDSYLEVFHPDMPFSDTPVAAFISEDIADIYQELKDFAANYQTTEKIVMNDSLAACLNAFAEHWGRKLLNTLRALHNIRYSENFYIDEDENIDSQERIGKNKSSIFGYLDDDENEEIDLLLN